MSPRRRRDYTSPAQAKPTIMAVALGVVGVFEFLECIENGDSKLKAARKAVKRAQLRAKAIQKAAKEVAPEIRKVEEEEEEDES